MFRPEIDWKEDGIDYRSTGYLPLIEDATAILRTLTEWVAELTRKEAKRLGGEMRKLPPFLKDLSDFYIGI